MDKKSWLTQPLRTRRDYGVLDDTLGESYEPSEMDSYEDYGIEREFDSVRDQYEGAVDIIEPTEPIEPVGSTMRRGQSNKIAAILPGATAVKIGKIQKEIADGLEKAHQEYIMREREASKLIDDLDDVLDDLDSRSSDEDLKTAYGYMVDHLKIGKVDMDQISSRFVDRIEGVTGKRISPTPWTCYKPNWYIVTA